jgi:hypothetical protein
MGNYPAVNSNPKYQEYTSYAAFPASAPTGYYALDASTSVMYQYDGSAWVPTSNAYDVPVDASVSDGDAVYWDATSGTLKQAQADVSSTAEAVGIATYIGGGTAMLLGNGTRAGGFSGFTPGSTIYLSDATPGALTSTRPSEVGWVEIGTAYDATSVDILIQSFGLFPDE